jgi:hypothetical protein
VPKPESAVAHIVTPQDTPFQRRMARGHHIRQGHPLDAMQVSADGVLWHTVRLCCGQAIPATVATWDEHVPVKPELKEVSQ